MFRKKIEVRSPVGAGWTAGEPATGALLPWVVLVAALLVAGCGGKESATGGDSPAPGAVATTAADDDDHGPCSLLTAEQVATVLPGHDGGSVAHNGGSLIKGVDSYQCSYTRIEGTDALLFTVIVHTAHDDAAFGEIKPSKSLHEGDEAVPAGDAAWVYGDDKDLKLRMLKGHSIVEFELMAPDAAAKKGAVVELARALAGKVS